MMHRQKGKGIPTPRTARARCESNVYHIYIRGVGRQIIFEDDVDRNEFVSLIEHNSQRLAVPVLAWVLMENHVHLLLHAEMSQISKFMQRLQTVYAMFFNKRHDHVGHLFQGRFGSQCIKNEAQLLAAVRYIHMNPAKAGLSQGPEYGWSSFREYTGHPRFSDTELVASLFSDTQELRSFHAQSSETGFIDTHETKRRYARISDCEVKAIIEKELGSNWWSTIGNLRKAERDALLRRLKNRGLSIRQIERMTGIGRSIIQRS